MGSTNAFTHESVLDHRVRAIDVAQVAFGRSRFLAVNAVVGLKIIGSKGIQAFTLNDEAGKSSGGKSTGIDIDSIRKNLGGFDWGVPVDDDFAEVRVTTQEFVANPGADPRHADFPTEYPDARQHGRESIGQALGKASGF